MYERAITGLMLVVALIHLLPISGFFGVERLTSLYDVEISGANMEILMRHRAILFGILGGFLAYAAFRPVGSLLMQHSGPPCSQSHSWPRLSVCPLFFI